MGKGEGFHPSLRQSQTYLTIKKKTLTWSLPTGERKHSQTGTFLKWEGEWLLIMLEYDCPGHTVVLLLRDTNGNQGLPAFPTLPLFHSLEAPPCSPVGPVLTLSLIAVRADGSQEVSIPGCCFSKHGQWIIFISNIWGAY